MGDLVSSAAAAYAAEHTSPLRGQLAEVAAWTRDNTESPGMMSGTPEARLLQALIVVAGARRVLEIGTFTAVGSLAMAAALAPGGRLTTLEADEQIAAVARRHIEASPHRDRIDLVPGEALESLADLEGPFDLVYVDASKEEYPAYYEAVLAKLAPRGILVADNLFRTGRVLDSQAQDSATAGMREFARRVHEDPGTHNVLLTVGDGLMLAWRAIAE